MPQPLIPAVRRTLALLLVGLRRRLALVARVGRLPATRGHPGLRADAGTRLPGVRPRAHQRARVRRQLRRLRQHRPLEGRRVERRRHPAALVVGPGPGARRGPRCAGRQPDVRRKAGAARDLDGLDPDPGRAHRPVPAAWSASPTGPCPTTRPGAPAAASSSPTTATASSGRSRTARGRRNAGSARRPSRRWSSVRPGIRYRPASRDLLISQQTSTDGASLPTNGHLYRLPLAANGRPGTLQTLWTSRPGDLPDGFGIARSGHVYVGLSGLSNQVVELSATGQEITRFGQPITGDNGSAGALRHPVQRDLPRQPGAGREPVGRGRRRVAPGRPRRRGRRAGAAGVPPRDGALLDHARSDHSGPHDHHVGQVGGDLVPGLAGVG